MPCATACTFPNSPAAVSSAPPPPRASAAAAPRRSACPTPTSTSSSPVPGDDICASVTPGVGVRVGTRWEPSSQQRLDSSTHFSLSRRTRVGRRRRCRRKGIHLRGMQCGTVLALRQSCCASQAGQAHRVLLLNSKRPRRCLTMAQAGVASSTEHFCSSQYKRGSQALATACALNCPEAALAGQDDMHVHFSSLLLAALRHPRLCLLSLP